MTRLQTAHALRAAHHTLRHDKRVDVELATIDHLLGAHGDQPSGVEIVAGVLDSALRLPETLTIRIALPEVEHTPETEISNFRRHCEAQARDQWGAAMTLRQGGFRELPRALGYAILAAVLGVASGYVAETVDGTLLTVVLYALAFVAVIAAWTIGWVPIEQALFDWRAPGHTASVYGLMAHARIEVVEMPRGGVGSPILAR